LINTAKSDTRVKVNIKGSVWVMALNNHDQRVYIKLPNVFYCPDLAAVSLLLFRDNLTIA
jgi:hypothetical protein